MHPVPASSHTPPTDGDWEVVNEPVWRIRAEPANELLIALRESNPDRARGAIDRLRDLNDKKTIGAECLDHLLDALGDADLSQANPAARPYVDALVRLKVVMTLKGFPGRRAWPEKQVESRLFESMPRTQMDEQQRIEAGRRWLDRIATFMTAGLVSPKCGNGLLEAAHAELMTMGAVHGPSGEAGATSLKARKWP